MERYSWIISAVLLAVLVGVTGWQRGRTGLGEALGKSWGFLWKGGGNLALGFLMAGFLAVLLPERLASTWMGEDSGLRGLWVGTLAGVLTPGGPYSHFPILAALAQKGAGIGPLAAYIAAWSLLGIHRILFWEVPFLGWRFVIVRIVACLIFPPVMGGLARAGAELLGDVLPGALTRG
jgi:hypothetical protein